jgi:hypothetical protein
MFRVALFAALAAVLLSAGVAQAQYYTTYYHPTTTYYQPATVYYAPAAATTTVAYAPAAVDACCCGNVQPVSHTTTYYAPATTYYAATPAVVYYRAVPRYASFYRWW